MSSSPEQKVHPVDMMIRKVSLSEAKERYEFIWREVNAALLAETKIQRTLYFDALLKSGRLVMDKLEEKGDFTEELWASYRQLIGHCVLSFGTVEVPKLLRLWEGIVKAVLRFPSKPVGLVNDYKNCVAAQREQYQLAYIKQQGKMASLDIDTANMGTFVTPRSGRTGDGKEDGKGGKAAAPDETAAASASPATPAIHIPKPSRPDLEYNGALNAAVPTLDPEDMLTLLNEVPTRMCFAHTNGILHMKLTNPLAIPQCTFVTTGYGCDTCKLQGLHIAYQAMLYDTEEEEQEAADQAMENAVTNMTMGHSRSRSGSGGAGGGHVRSDAQIAKKKFHGFDICSGCALYFFLEQKKNFMACLKAPHTSFALGHASGVRIAEARYVVPKAKGARYAQSPLSFAGSGDFPNRGDMSSASLPQTPPSFSLGNHEEKKSSPVMSRRTSSHFTDARTPLTGAAAVGSNGTSGSPAVAIHGRSVSHVPMSSTTGPATVHRHTGSYSAMGTAASPADSVQSLPAPPSRPPQWHRTVLATHSPADAATTMLQRRRHPSESSDSQVSSGRGAPLPPKFRASPAKADRSLSPCVSQCSTPCSAALSSWRCSSLELIVTIAPYGARPLAWVLPATVQTVKDSQHPAQASLGRYMPPPDLASRCTIRSTMAYKRAQAKATRAAPARTHTAGLTPATSSGAGSKRSSGTQEYGDLAGPLVSPRGCRDSVAAREGEDEPETPHELNVTARPGAAPHIVLVHPSDSEFEDSSDNDSDGPVGFPARSRSTFDITVAPLAAGRKERPASETDSIDDVSDLCTICLGSLADDVPVIETECHHFFHVECIEGFVRMNEDTCPLCRTPNALPDLCLQTALRENTFHITLRLTDEEARQECLTVCVASVLTRSGHMDSIMSVAAASCVTVQQPVLTNETLVQRTRTGSGSSTSIGKQKQGPLPSSAVSPTTGTSPATKSITPPLGVSTETAVRPRDRDPRMRAVREGVIAASPAPLAASPSRANAVTVKRPARQAGPGGGSGSVGSSIDSRTSSDKK